MIIFKSEDELLNLIEKHNQFVCECAKGSITFEVFCEKYNNFYEAYALDGHESDEEERAFLVQHEAKINPHRIIASEILSRVFFESKVNSEVYKVAGRFSPEVAQEKLQQVAQVICEQK